MVINIISSIYNNSYIIFIRKKEEAEAIAKENRRKKREEKRKRKAITIFRKKEEDKVSMKIAREGQKLIKAQRQLESIRLLDELFDRIKVNINESFIIIIVFFIIINLTKIHFLY